MDSHQLKRSNPGTVLLYSEPNSEGVEMAIRRELLRLLKSVKHLRKFSALHVASVQCPWCWVVDRLRFCSVAQFQLSWKQRQSDISCSLALCRPLHGSAGRPDQPLDPRQLVLGRGSLGPLSPAGRVLHRRLFQGAEQACSDDGGQRRLYVQARAVTLEGAVCTPAEATGILTNVTTCQV